MQHVAGQREVPITCSNKGNYLGVWNSIISKSD